MPTSVTLECVELRNSGALFDDEYSRRTAQGIEETVDCVLHRESHTDESATALLIPG